MPEHWESLTRIIRDFYNQNFYSQTGQISLGRLKVVVTFLSQLIFIFPLSLGMVMYTNEFETRENTIN